MKKPVRAKSTVPEVYHPWVKTPQPDGSIIFRAGKAQILEKLVGTNEASRISGMSMRWVQNECDLGRFTTARKTGLKARSHWKIERAEVLARKEIGTG